MKLTPRIRMTIAYVVAAMTGITLGLLRAPFWAGILAVFLLCVIFLPWAMMGKIDDR